MACPWHYNQDNNLQPSEELFLFVAVYMRVSFLTDFLLSYTFLKYILHIFLFFPLTCQTNYIQLVASQTCWQRFNKNFSYKHNYLFFLWLVLSSKINSLPHKSFPPLIYLHQRILYFYNIPCSSFNTFSVRPWLSFLNNQNFLTSFPVLLLESILLELSTEVYRY